uniref:Uncharacterized protein n=1 Tax=Taeniopygia guttata TaxID=59729 RepID=A0A674HSV9_TAEGU
TGLSPGCREPGLSPGCRETGLSPGCRETGFSPGCRETGLSPGCRETGLDLLNGVTWEEQLLGCGSAAFSTCLRKAVLRPRDRSVAPALISSSPASCLLPDPEGQQGGHRCHPVPQQCSIPITRVC